MEIFRNPQSAIRNYNINFTLLLLAVSCMSTAQAAWHTSQRGYWRPDSDNTAKVGAAHTTCATPDSAGLVHLPVASRREFRGVGTTVRRVAFEIELTACDAESPGLAYQLIPSHRQTSAWTRTHTSGVLIPDSRSTSSGVAVRVLDENTRPVAFEQDAGVHTMAYHSGGKSTKITLQAQYIQTDPIILPGSLHAAMEVMYLYQ